MMNGREIIKTLLEQSGATTAEFARKMGLSNATVWARLNGPDTRDMPLSTFCDMLNVMGYSLAVIPSEEAVEDETHKIVTVDGSARINNSGWKKGVSRKKVKEESAEEG